MQSIKELHDRIEALENKNKKYDYVPDMPKWAQEAITKLYNSGLLKGDGEKLGLDENTVRILCVLVRALETKNLI